MAFARLLVTLLSLGVSHARATAGDKPSGMWKCPPNAHLVNGKCGCDHGFVAKAGACTLPIVHVAAATGPYRRQHNCPDALKPGLRQNGPDFASAYGRQGCCLLDRAIGAMEFLRNLRLCADFHSHLYAASFPPDHSSDPTEDTVRVGAAIWRELPDEMSPCFSGALEALARDIGACCPSDSAFLPKRENACEQLLAPALLHLRSRLAANARTCKRCHGRAEPAAPTTSTTGAGCLEHGAVAPAERQRACAAADADTLVLVDGLLRAARLLYELRYACLQDLLMPC
jgi:hypothetical protein